MLRASLFLAAVSVLSACQKEVATPLPPKPVLSLVLAPVTADLTEFTGLIQSRYVSELGFEVTGRLVQRSVFVGDVVKAGQQLAKLDPLPYELQLRISAAQLKSAEAERENATANEVRERGLLAKKVTSQASYDAARQALESAQANVESAQAKLAKSREQLSNTIITAQFEGVVTEVKAEPGQIVQAGQTVITVARPDVREAVVDVPEPVGRSLKAGSPFQVWSQARPQLRTSGRVREIAPLADAATRTYRVRISLDEPPAGLRLGSIVTAVISAPVVQTLIVPETAVWKDKNDTSVWVISDKNVLAKRTVQVEPRGDALQVVKGLSAGERIVTAGVGSLKEGQHVRIADGAAL